MTATVLSPKMIINDQGHYVQEQSELTIFLKAHFYVCKKTLTLIRYNSTRAKNYKEFLRFGNLKSLQDHIDRAKASLQRVEDSIQERKQAKASVTRNANIGDIFVSSWGWEQTNVDYYQVVELKGAKSYVMRKVTQKRHDSEGLSSMACYVSPEYNSFYGDELFIGRVTDENRIKVNKRTASLKAVVINENNEREYTKDYCSWYG